MAAPDSITTRINKRRFTREPNQEERGTVEIPRNFSLFIHRKQWRSVKEQREAFDMMIATKAPVSQELGWGSMF